MTDRQQIARRMVAPADLGLPDRPVGADAIASLRDGLAALGQRAHLLCAASTSIAAPPPDHVIQLRLAAFPATFTDEDRKKRSNGHWYIVDGGKLALHRNALDQLASAAGLSDVRDGCRVELLAPYHWHATHTVQLLTLEGSIRQISRSVEIDLRDGAPETAAYGEDERGRKGLNNARKFGLRTAQSKAANRAIRAALGLQSAYEPAQAEKPFVFPALVYVPPSDDPEIRRMIAAQRLGIAAALYGPAPAAAPSRPLVIDADLEDDFDADAAEAGVVEDDRDERPPTGELARPTKASTAALPTCRQCAAEITVAQANATDAVFGMPLCSAHTRGAR